MHHLEAESENSEAARMDARLLIYSDCVRLTIGYENEQPASAEKSRIDKSR